MSRRLGAMAVVVSALAAAALLCAMACACGIPLGAIRRTPPEGLESRIATEHARAPDFTVEGTTGPFHLADALARGHVLLVFYRGRW